MILAHNSDYRPGTNGAVATIRPAVLTRPTTASEVAAAWLIGYRGATRTAYATDLREWAGWLERAGVEAFGVHRAHVEAYSRDLELAGRAPATIARKLSALASYYAYALDEELVGRNPVVRVRRPKVSDESPSTGLSRGELRAILAAAARSGPRDAALALVLALTGARISEALGADVVDVSTERGHRTLSLKRKGGKRQRMPLPPAASAAVDAMLSARAPDPDAPLFVTSSGRRLSRREAGKAIAKLGRHAGIGRSVSPHAFRHAFVTLSLDTGAELQDVQDAVGHSSPVMTQRYNRSRRNLDRFPGYRLGAMLAE
jgi:integrase/recombinase XerD